jgi:hypothetical protein
MINHKLSEIDPIEQDFMRAIKALSENKPTNKTLKLKLKKGLKVSVNAVNVAIEAGHSRTLIAMDNCKYPKVREALKLAKGNKTASHPTTYSQLIENLRANLAQEKTQTKMLQEIIADHFIARKNAEDNLIRSQKLVSQLRKEIHELRKLSSI